MSRNTESKITMKLVGWLLFSSSSLPLLACNTAFANNMACDKSLSAAFSNDKQTSVLLTKTFQKGQPLLLKGKPDAKTPVAQNDLCLVKINVGPGNSGPKDAPSTSQGIGIEIWLPSPQNWNGRIHVKGGGGWAGSTQSSTTELALDSSIPVGSSADTAGIEGAVSATTDTGHSFVLPWAKNAAGGNGSFALNPDGTINRVLWKDFSERAIHEMAVKTKELTRFYYGKPASYSYWDGFSTGGRQALKEAQVNPNDFDGILAGAPAINWTKFITTELYPQVAMMRDLNSIMSQDKITFLSKAAINACDVIGDVHMGYVVDPQQCQYDPTKDKSVLCKESGGEASSGLCVTAQEAQTMNKIWYGLTTDGSVPSPIQDNGMALNPTGKHHWYGLTRGSNLGLLTGTSPFSVAATMVAIELGETSIATNALVNKTGNGQDNWKNLSYAQINKAFDNGLKFQSEFANINTDSPDLSAFQARKGKLLLYHGLSDFLIPPQGSINYYNRVMNTMGGLKNVQSFFKFYLIPGMGHAFVNGTASTMAEVPLPTHELLYAKLTSWVEKGITPEQFDAEYKNNGKVRTFPICLYPQKAVHKTGDPLKATSYVCE